MRDKANEELTKIIETQNNLILELVNENTEKENMIEVLFEELSSIRD